MPYCGHLGLLCYGRANCLHINFLMPPFFLSEIFRYYCIVNLKLSVIMEEAKENILKHTCI